MERGMRPWCRFVGLIAQSERMSNRRIKSSVGLALNVERAEISSQRFLLLASWRERTVFEGINGESYGPLHLKRANNIVVDV